MIRLPTMTLKFLWISLVLIFCTNSCKSQITAISKLEIQSVNYTENCKETGSSLKYNLPIVKGSNQNSKKLETLIIQKLLDDDVFLFVNEENIEEIENSKLSEVIKKELNLAKLNCNSDDATSTSIECDYKVNFHTDQIISIQFSITTMQSNFNQFYININYDIDNQKELGILDLINGEGVDYILKKSNTEIEKIIKEFISDTDIDKEDIDEVKSQGAEFGYGLNTESLKQGSFIVVIENMEKGLKLDYDFPFDKRLTNMLRKPDLFFSFEELKQFLRKPL